MRLGLGLGMSAGLRPSLALEMSSALDSRITFTRASKGWATNALGLIAEFATNAARFDHDPVTLAPRGLLIEGSRINTLVYSDQIDPPTNWFTGIDGTGVAPNVTPNTGVAPDGTTTAELVEFDRGVGNTSGDRSKLFSPYAATTNGQVHAGSIWIKAADAPSVGKSIRMFSDGLGAASVKTIPADWTRISFTGTAAAASVLLALESRGTITENAFNVLLWRGGMELGSFATSSIPTVATAVTREADIAAMTGTNFSSWFNATEGTVVVEFETPASGVRTVFAFDDNSANNWISLYTSGTSLMAGVTVGGVGQASITVGTVTANTRHKAAFAWKANDFAASLDGAAAVTDSAGTIPTVDRARLGVDQAGNYLNGPLKSFRSYKIRLPDATLQSLAA